MVGSSGVSVSMPVVRRTLPETERPMKKYLALALMLFVVSIGCRRSTNGNPAVSSASYLVDSDAFDLQTVSALFQTGAVTDLNALEQKINDPNSGINNVDVDKDGQVDFVAAEEVQNTTGGKTVNFVAYPSSKGGQDATTIATTTIAPTPTGAVAVESGYSDAVQGYDQNYYRYEVAPGPSFSSMLLLSYMLSPRPALYYHPYSYYTPLYHPHPLLTPSIRTSYRSSFQTTTHVSPVPKMVRPSSYTTPGKKAPSGYVSPGKAGSISQGAGQMGDYKVNTSPAKPATGFGGKPSTPAVAPKSFPQSSPPKTGGFGGGFSKPSGPSFKSGKK